MSEKTLTIAITGTFDLLNYGDLLFPLLMEKEISKRIVGVDFLRFSYRPVEPPIWVYKVHPIQELPHYLEDINGIIVGGGHLVRFDKTIAPGYEPTSEKVHHPTGYWLIPAILG